ncbi:MAG: CBS domain-containing protein [Elainellaceae cyanobacterium]
MDIVLCHTTADFDTLGAAVGATRLYPGAKLVLTGGAHPTVKAFLALHRDAYAIIERRAVNPEAIRRLIVVDASRRDRLGKAADWLDLPHANVIVYDHHSAIVGSPSAGRSSAARGSGMLDVAREEAEEAEEAEEDIIDGECHIESVGATVTLIVEALQQQSLTLTAEEATVMALGIHADTGSLTFDNTTARDVAALAWLMPWVSLNVIAEYVKPNIPTPLQAVLTDTLDQAQTTWINGVAVAVVRLDLQTKASGLSSLASHLLETLDSDVLLLAAQYPASDSYRLVLIGRVQSGLWGMSQLDNINLAQIFSSLGGGGHPKAAAATVKGADRDAVIADVLDQIQQQLPQPMTAREIMSSPVRTVRPQLSVDEAQRILLRYGHSGLCVVDGEDQLAGIISRRDVDLALHHSLGHAPVKGFMTRTLTTITPEATLPEIETLMVNQDIGRLPVLGPQDNLVGIVTRTDVLRQLHQTQTTRAQPNAGDRQSCPLPEVMEQALRDRLKPSVWQLLQTAAAQAQSRGWQLYVVGGAVRDLLLQRSNRPLALEDIDLVVDGFHHAADSAAGVELAQALQRHYTEARLQIHGQFQTAALLWHQDSDLGALWLDIATARTEFYPYPAANPQVEASSIRQDLYRRDFTINALAIQLTAPRLGRLLDFFGGQPDLDRRLIRVLHANSFIEDPTRIFRAVRFAVRLGFELEAQTEGYIRHAIASGVYRRVQAETNPTPALQTRLRRELKYVLEAPYWRSAVQMLASLDALQCLHPALQVSPELWRQLRLTHRGLARFDHNHQLAHWQVMLEVILAQLPAGERQDVATHLQLPADAIERLQQLSAAEAHLTEALAAEIIPSEAYNVLQSYSLELLVLICVRGTGPIRRLVWHHITVWSHLNLPLDGNDLKAMGYKPGRQFKTMLDALRAAVINGEIAGEAQARYLICDRFSKPE